MAKFTNKDALIRIYDGTTPSPWYMQYCLENGDFSGPIGIPTLEEILVMPRGRAEGSCEHYINGADNAVYEPVTVSFSVMMGNTDTMLYLLDWFEGNTVNGHTTVTSKGTTERITGFTLPDFHDTSKKCFNIEYLMELASGGGGNTICYKFNECYFDLMDQTFAEAEDGINLTLTGMCYGSIVRATTFTTGTPVY